MSHRLSRWLLTCLLAATVSFGLWRGVTLFAEPAQSADAAAARQSDCAFFSPGRDRLAVGFTSPLNRIYRAPPHCGEPAAGVHGSARVSLARNEFESIQLVLFAPRTLTDIGVEIAALKRRDGSAVSRPPASRQRVVGYVSQVTAKVQGSRIGWQPDPLLPAQPVDLQPGEPRAFLLTFHAADDTPAGVYTSRVSITRKGKPIAVRELEIRVWNFSLPKRARFTTASFPGYEIADRLWPQRLGYPRADDTQRMRRFLKLADLGFRNRLPPLGFIANGLDSRDRYGESVTRLNFPLYRNSESGDMQFDSAQADTLIDYLSARGAQRFFIAFTSNIYKVPELAAARERTLLRYLDDYHRYLKQRKLLDRVYLYNIDEPWDTALDDARRIYRLIKQRYGDDFRVMQNTNQDNDAVVGLLLGHFDVLDINLGFYEATRLDAYRRNNPGALSEVWWNLNLWPDSRPNLFLEYPPIDARIIGPMSFRFAMQGFEYWHLAALYGVENYHPVHAGELNVDWRVGEQSLDGLLVYPTQDFGFFSSLRLENFRDGMEDQAYLYRLAALDPDNPLLAVPVVRSVGDYETRSNAYMAFRQQLGNRLEQLQPER